MGKKKDSVTDWYYQYHSYELLQRNVVRLKSQSKGGEGEGGEGKLLETGGRGGRGLGKALENLKEERIKDTAKENHAGDFWVIPRCRVRKRKFF